MLHGQEHIKRNKSHDIDKININAELFNVTSKEAERISEGAKNLIKTGSTNINTPHDDKFPKPFNQKELQDLSQVQGDRQFLIGDRCSSHSGRNQDQFNCEVEANHSYNALPPFSEKLKKDEAIKYSRVRIKETMIFWLNEEKLFDKTNIDKLKLVADHPTPHILAKLASKAYRDYDKDLPEGWKLLTSATNISINNSYFGAAFWNPKQQHVVIAHRGTDPKKYGAIRTDLIGIVFNNFVGQMDSASTFTALITSVLNEINKEMETNFQLFFTGHSLGGWLAQITTFTAKYLTLLNDNSFIFVKPNHEGYHGHAVVFDSPGCKNMLYEILDTFAPRYDTTYSLPIDSLDITSYLSAPNLINTRNSHFGTVYRIFIDLSKMKNYEKATPLYNLVTHKMEGILKSFDSVDLEIKEVLDWPISMGLRGEELNKFFEEAKHLNNYDPHVESYLLYSTIRYQVKNVEENIRNVNVFTQEERLFLEKYQQLRALPDNKKPQNLFSEVNDEVVEKEIIKNLQHFNINSKSIICRDKVELQKFIPYVNTLLYFFPLLKTTIDKALSETGIMEAIIDSQSKVYLESINKYFQQFTDDNELKTLIMDTKQVSLISVEEECSIGLARIYKAFAHHAEFDRAKHISKLEKLLYLKELLHFKKTMSSFVDVFCKSKSLILFECTLNLKLEHNKDIVGEFLYCLFQKLQNQPETKIILVVHSSKKDNLDDIVRSNAEKLELEYRIINGMTLTWNNLSIEFQEEILKRPLIVFQGQNEISLKEIILDNHVGHIALVSDQDILVSLINNEKIVIDINLPIASDYDASFYIERTFNHHIEINMNIFKDKSINDLLVISGTDKVHLEKFGLSREKIHLFQEYSHSKDSINKIILIENEEGKENFKQLCKEYHQDNIHWLHSESDKLIWQQSHGNITRLHEYIEKGDSHTKKYSETDLLKINQRVMIISDTAGMGKSTTLANLSHKIKEQNPDTFLFRIDLNDYTKELEKQKAQCNFKTTDIIESVNVTIQFLGQDLLKFNSSTKQLLFHYYCHRYFHNMILMLDGFDEISPNYKDIVIEFVKTLMNTAIKQIWITTRPNMRSELEDTFQQFAYTLKSFSEDEQQEFLTKFWQKKLKEINNDRLQIYAKALVKLLANSISDNKVEFTGIPLQTRMLAEAFQEECGEFCQSKEIRPQLSEKFEIIDLYEKFLTQKYKIYQEKKNKLDLSKPGVKGQSQSYLEFIEDHQDMALYMLFNECELEILFNEKLCNEFSKTNPKVGEKILQNKDLKQSLVEDLFQNKIANLISLIDNIKEGNENMGVIDQVINDRPRFIHRTFAEYLAAKYLVSNLDNKTITNFMLQEILLQPSYEVIRTFFNGLLLKQMISNDVKKHYGEIIEKLWFTDRNNLCNKNGNTILHIAAEENNATIISFLLHHFKNNTKDVISLLEACNDDNILKYTALCIAAEKGYLTVVQCLIEIGADLNARNVNGDTILHSAALSGNLKIVKYLVTKGADLNAINDCGYTVLHSGCLSGKLEIVEYMLENGADINAKNDYGDTILHRAALSGKLVVVRYLVEKGAYLNVMNKDGITILHSAALSGKVLVVKYLLENGADLNATSNSGDTILHRASLSGNFEIVKYLIEKGANQNATNNNGETILHSAAQSGKVEVLQYLIDKGFKLNATSNSGDTILYSGCASGNLVIVDYLVSKGANINATNKYGDTILHRAALSGNVEIVKYLIEKGAGLKVTNNRGDTILHRGSESGNLEIVKYLLKEEDNINATNNYGDTILHSTALSGKVEVMQYLVEKGADLKVTNNNGDTILHLVSQSRNLNKAKYLVSKGADVNARNVNGDTILHSSSRSGNLEIVKYLLEKKADVNSKNNYGDTVLHSAALSGKLIVVQYLVEKEARVNARNNNGDTILHNGSLSGNLEIVKYLVEKGANVNDANNNSETILHNAVLSGKIVVVQYLVENGADVNATNVNGQTILHCGSLIGNLEIVKYLLEKEANLTSTNINGDTILHRAALSGNVILVQYLLEKGANVKATNLDGDTILHTAALSGNVILVQYLVENGADVNATNFNGDTILHRGCLLGNLEIIKYLVEKGANVNSINKNGDTILNSGSLVRNLEIIKYLVEKGVDVNSINNSGDTVLHSDSRSGNLEIVKYLVEIGANVNAINKQGHTILHSAELSGDVKVIQYLEAKVADVNALKKDC